MTRKELLKLALKVKENEKLYNRPGLDDTSRTFLFAIRENLVHQNRKRIFENYTGYEQRY